MSSYRSCPGNLNVRNKGAARAAIDVVVIYRERRRGIGVCPIELYVGRDIGGRPLRGALHTLNAMRADLIGRAVNRNRGRGDGVQAGGQTSRREREIIVIG